MDFKQIGPVSPAFKAVWKIYLSSFPPEERRSLAKQRKIFDDTRYSLIAAYNKGQLVGLISSWDFDDFVFVEHLAVKARLRCRGHGTEMLKRHIEKSGRPTVLEIERPDTKIAKRRIHFYDRIGFKVNEYDYSHPPYGKGKKGASLHLMSYPGQLTDAEYDMIKSTLLCFVYEGQDSCTMFKNKCIAVQPAE